MIEIKVLLDRGVLQEIYANHDDIDIRVYEEQEGELDKYEEDTYNFYEVGP